MEHPYDHLWMDDALADLVGARHGVPLQIALPQGEKGEGVLKCN